MSDFIRVVGQDVSYKSLQAYLYIHRSLIVKVHPVYAEVVNGHGFLCTPTHPKAQLICYMLIDQRGEQYTCADADELRKLGIEINGKKKDKIGFFMGENKQEVGMDTGEHGGEA